MNQQLGITINNYPNKLFNNGLLCNPVKGYEVLLLPTEILHKLPVAKSWEEIDSVIVENNTIRAMMNNEVAEHWTQWAATDRKYYLREKIFKTQKSVSRLSRRIERKNWMHTIQKNRLIIFLPNYGRE